jgi:type IV pilus assembly protein PilY1
MDGPITAFNGSTGKFVYATMRRGGRSTYAFDVTSPASPVLKWRVGCADSTDADCTPGFTGIGQTWSSAKSFTAAGYGSGTAPLLIFGGGYDNCEDFDGVLGTKNANNNCGAASKGHYVYVVDAITGALVASFDTLGTRGVVADVTLVRNSDGQVIYGYTADLGGNVYRVNFGSGAATTWTMTKIASLGCSTTSTCPANRKFMFAPSVVALGGDVYGIGLGSGDREKPLTYYAATTSVANYFFEFNDKPTVSTSIWPGTGCGSAVICLDSLLPITGNTTPSDADLSAKKGWYLSLTPTEQVVTSAVTIFGVVTFSTHQPATAPVPGSCSSNLGTTRVYNIGFTNAASANGTGERWEDVAGDGLPPSPVAGRVTLDDGTTVPFCIGCSKDSPLEGAPPKGLASVVQPKNRLYWYIQK